MRVSGRSVREDEIRQAVDGGQGRACLIVAINALAVLLLDRQRNLQGVQGIQSQTALAADEYGIIRNLLRAQILFAFLDDHLLEFEFELFPVHHVFPLCLARRRPASARQARPKPNSRKASGATAASPPGRRNTSRKPSSPQAMGENRLNACITGGIRKRGTMMPPTAAISRLATPVKIVACSPVDTRFAISSA